jgi:hypothetical protein
VLNLSGKLFKTESASSEPESLIDELKSAIGKMSQALILHTIVADHFLSTQMARPVAELREEGFFDDVTEAFSYENMLKESKAARQWCGYGMTSGVPTLIRKFSETNLPSRPYQSLF